MQDGKEWWIGWCKGLEEVVEWWWAVGGGGAEGCGGQRGVDLIGGKMGEVKRGRVQA